MYECMNADPTICLVTTLYWLESKWIWSLNNTGHEAGIHPGWDAGLSHSHTHSDIGLFDLRHPNH